MKVFFICLIILFSLSFGFVGVAQGQTIKDYPSLVEVSLQVQLRDSEGQLVAYYEPIQTYVVDIEAVHESLDAKANKTTISKDGKNLQVIKWSQSGSYKKTSHQTAFSIMHRGNLGLVVFLDGYLTEPGDRYTASWKVVRPLN